MEFVMNTDLEKSLPQKIDFNYESLKTELAGKLKYYNGLVVTEDSIKGAKGDKAALNKLKTALEDRRKDIKREYLRPFDEFEVKVKELVSMIDAPVQAIDGQIKAFDEQKKAEKKAEIEAFYAESVGDLSTILPLEKVWDSRWLNTTYKIADIQQEITDRTAKVSNDIGVIKGMRLDCETQVMDTYLRTLDMSAALAEKTRLEDQKRRMEEYEAAQKKAAQEATQEPNTVIVDGTPGHDLRDCKPGDYVVFGADYGVEQGTTAYVCPGLEARKTIKVVFYDTSEAFRHEMRQLTEKHNIRYGGLN